MLRKVLLAAVAGIAVFASGGVAHAQIFYPGGYGGYGWGGWGGGATPQGDIARGMGVFAAGAGYYNLQTAQATSINADTAVNWNEYWYQSQQNLNRKYWERTAQRRARNNETQQQMFNRLRDNPSRFDIYRGDAMNIVGDELANPKIYLRGLSAANTKFPGEMVRDIPFMYAAEAVTATVHGILSKQGAPASLKTEAFQDDIKTLRGLADKIRQEHSEDGIDPETLDQVEAALKDATAKVEKVYARGTRERSESLKFLRAVQGLSRMLRTPAINVLLADVEDHPSVTVGDVLMFMRAFNLRFGSADTPRERMVYDQLYPLLVRIRDEAMPNAKPGLPEEVEPNANHPADFFEKMDPKAFSGDEVPPHPVPPPAGAASQPK